MRPGGFEPSTLRLEVSCSIQLSYGRMRASAWMIIAYGRGRDEVGLGSYQTPWLSRWPCYPIRPHIRASGFHVSLSLANALLFYVITLGQMNRHPSSRSRFPYHASSNERFSHSASQAIEPTVSIASRMQNGGRRNAPLPAKYRHKSSYAMFVEPYTWHRYSVNAKQESLHVISTPM